GPARPGAGFPACAPLSVRVRLIVTFSRYAPGATLIGLQFESFTADWIVGYISDGTAQAPTACAVPVSSIKTAAKAAATAKSRFRNRFIALPPLLWAGKTPMH